MTIVSRNDNHYPFPIGWYPNLPNNLHYEYAIAALPHQKITFCARHFANFLLDKPAHNGPKSVRRMAITRVLRFMTGIDNLLFSLK